MTRRISLGQLVGFSLLFGWSIQMSTPESNSYTAGVVEYYQESKGLSPKELFTKNAENYTRIINSTEAKDVDIIVFPESTLNSVRDAVFVPSEHEDVNLCTTEIEIYNHDLKPIACAALGQKKYVVVNLYTRHSCSSIANHTPCIFNTNVVFDRTGKVVSLHRKHNVFAEKKLLTAAKQPEMSTFSTDFNVTFGHFTSFEILFKSPALDLVAHQHIKNIIFPSKWFSELPFLTAVQIQQNWAYRNDVNFLGAGANDPSLGNGGSGIYSGKSRALTSIMTGENKTSLLVHEVPKVPGHPVGKPSSAYKGSHFNDFKLMRDQLEFYSLRNIELPDSTNKKRHHNFELCAKNDTFCCQFLIHMTLESVPDDNSGPNYTYMAAVFSGKRSFDEVDYGDVKACAVLACTNNTNSSCGMRHFHNEANNYWESKYNFQILSVSGIWFPKYNILTMPSSLNFKLSPYPPTDIEYLEDKSEHGSYKLASITLRQPKRDLLTFGIYGLASASSKITTNIVVMLLAAFNIKLFVFRLSGRDQL